MSRLTIFAKIKAKSDEVELVKSELMQLVSISQAEPGCIQYHLYQDNGDPSYFIIHEVWQSRDYWEKHVNRQHLADYLKAVDGAVEEFSLKETTAIG
ncbi:putative quinol monooxygenase [Kangiella sp. TOML190]|uniref:putative quinol monooxygenase n=1 Tax=Kangiella sp. TOML190 TaxID=2931351 RepID=UPI002040E977|nr:putative quinol monooxygenase [Kangiella sp. TOML190]